MPAPFVYAQTAAQDLLQLLQSPSPTPAPTTTTTRSTVSAPPNITGPVGVSLSTHITLGADLMPENSIIPEAPATTTPDTPTTSVASSTPFLIQSLYAELKALEAQIAALEASSTTTNTPAGPITTFTNSCMPLTRLFDAAFEAACKTLHDTGQPAIVREIIAQRIIAAASRGERDLTRLRDAGLAGCERVSQGDAA